MNDRNLCLALVAFGVGTIMLTQGGIVTACAAQSGSRKLPMPSTAVTAAEARINGSLTVLQLQGPHKGAWWVDLASAEQLEIAAPEDSVSISGPDRTGRWAFLRVSQQVIGKPSAEIGLIDKDRTSIKSLVKLKNEIDHWSVVSLSDDGKWLALLSQTHLGALKYTEWSIDIIDVSTGSTVATVRTGRRSRPVWIQGSDRIAFVRDPVRPPGQPSSNTTERRLDKSGEVVLRNVLSGEETTLAKGDTIAPADGASLLVLLRETIRQIDIETQHELMTCPLTDGVSGGIIGKTPEGEILYEGYASKNEERRKLSFRMYGPGEAWTIKALQPSTEKARTVVGDIEHGSVDYRVHVL
jgi:hypothetical protein